MPQPESNTNSYRSLLRGFSIFGGVQVFNAVVGLVRSKFVAMFLGPAGMGVTSLFNSAALTLQRLSSLGLSVAITKEVGAAEEADSGVSPSRHLPVALAAIYRLLFLTALAGMLICLLGAPLLSKLTFGTTEMTMQFRVLGVGVFLMISSGGKLAILQGLQQRKSIAVASCVGALSGLFFGVPLYYFFGEKGIVPAICIFWLMVWLTYTISIRRATVGRRPARFSWGKHSPIMRKLLVIGAMLMTADLLQAAVAYAINLYIRLTGDVADVGLYQAAYSLTIQFSGLVFSALIMDYFPRLTRISGDNPAIRALVNRQIELVAVVMCAGAALLILFAPFVVSILLTEEFQPIVPLLRWMAFGTLLRVISFPLGYITLAKDNKKVFFLQTLSDNILVLLTAYLGYHYFGLIGLGYGFVAENILCNIIYYLINNRLYGFRFTIVAVKRLIPAVVLGTCCFAASFLTDKTIATAAMLGITAVAGIWCIMNLRRLLKSKEA